MGKSAAGGVRPRDELLRNWARAPYWRPEEGVALAFGLEPTEVREARFDHNSRLRVSEKKTIAHFEELASRAVDAGDLAAQARPEQFQDWARRIGLLFHWIWADAIEEETGGSRARKSASEIARVPGGEAGRPHQPIEDRAPAPPGTSELVPQRVKGGRPVHPAKLVYEEMGFDRGGRSLKELQTYIRAKIGSAPSANTIREWEKVGRRSAPNLEES